MPRVFTYLYVLVCTPRVRVTERQVPGSRAA